MGIGKFPPPTKSMSLNRSTKNWQSWLCPNLVQIQPLRAYGQMDEIQRKIFLCILFFSGSRTGQTRWWIFTRDSPKDVKSRKDVPFGGLNDAPLSFLVKPPKKLKFWGVNRIFNPERKKIQIFITWKLLSRSRRNFYRKYAPRICLRDWSHGFPTNPRWRRPPSLISAKCQ